MRCFKKTLCTMITLIFAFSCIFVVDTAVFAEDLYATANIYDDQLSMTLNNVVNDNQPAIQAGETTPYFGAYGTNIVQNPLDIADNKVVLFDRAKAPADNFPAAVRIYKQESSNFAHFQPKANTDYEIEFKYYVETAPSKADASFQVRLTPNSQLYGNGGNAFSTHTVWDIVTLAQNQTTSGWQTAKLTFTTPSSAGYLGLYLASKGTAMYSGLAIYVDDVTIREFVAMPNTYDDQMSITLSNVTNDNQPAIQAGNTTPYFGAYGVNTIQNPLNAVTNNVILFDRAKAPADNFPAAVRIYDPDSSNFAHFQPNTDTEYEIEFKYYVATAPSRADVSFQVRLTPNSQLYGNGSNAFSTHTVWDIVTLAQGQTTSDWQTAKLTFTTPSNTGYLGLYLASKGTAMHSGLAIYVDDVTIREYGILTPPETGLNGLELHTTKIYDNFSNQGNYDRPDIQTIWDDYTSSPQYGQHPRLMITADSVSTLQDDVVDPDNPKYWWYNRLVSRADQLYEQMMGLNGYDPDDYLFTYTKCFETRMPGANNSGTAADQFKDKIMILGMMYQITEDTKYADAAWVVLDRVISFPDINPWHDLDFGIFCQGYAIAYDWMYDAWTPAQRETLAAAIKYHCFRTANDSYTHNTPTTLQDGTNGVVRGVYTANNHNPIVNSGVIMTALALMDKYPAIAPSLCHDAFICLERDLNMFNPHGATTEGTEYMILTADNLSFAFSSLESAIGELYGMDTCPGLTGGKLMRVVHGIESSVGAFSFGDTLDGFITYPGELWFDKHYNISGFRTTVFNRLKSNSANNFTHNVQILCWYEPETGNPTITLDKDMTIGAGTNFPSTFATFRSDFTNTQTFVGVKAGRTVRDYFVHLDQGSFVYHALGVKWAIDLGKDGYTLPGYMDPTNTNNDRWKIFRLRPDGHNTLLIGPSASDFGYAFNQTASLTTQSSDTQAMAVVNMQNLVSSKTTSAQRGFLLTDNRRSLVVRDEVTLKQAYDLYWVMYVPNSITIEFDGNSAMLKKSEGVKVRLDIVSSSTGSFQAGTSAAPWSLAPTVSDQNSNSSYKRIVYKITGATGSVDITAKLTPVMGATANAPGVSTYGAISTWSVN